MAWFTNGSSGSSWFQGSSSAPSLERCDRGDLHEFTAMELFKGHDLRGLGLETWANLQVCFIMFPWQSLNKLAQNGIWRLSQVGLENITMHVLSQPHRNSCFVNQIAFPIWKVLIGTNRRDAQGETSGFSPTFLQMSCYFATWAVENENFQDARRNNIQAR